VHYHQLPPAVAVLGIISRRSWRGEGAVGLELQPTAALRLHRAPGEIEALLGRRVVGPEPQVQLIAGGDDAPAVGQMVAAIASNYLGSRRSAIVDLQPVEAALRGVLQIEAVEGYVHHQRLVGADHPGALGIVLVASALRRIPQPATRITQHPVAAAEARLAPATPVARQALADEAIGAGRGGTTASSVLARLPVALTRHRLTDRRTEPTLAHAGEVRGSGVQANAVVLWDQTKEGLEIIMIGYKKMEYNMDIFLMH